MSLEKGTERFSGAVPTWIDRASRVLAICWIVSAVLDGIVVPAAYFVLILRIYTV